MKKIFKNRLILSYVISIMFLLSSCGKETEADRANELLPLIEKYFTEEVYPEMVESWNSTGIVDDIQIDVRTCDFDYRENENKNGIETYAHYDVYVTVESNLLAEYIEKEDYDSIYEVINLIDQTDYNNAYEFNDEYQTVADINIHADYSENIGKMEFLGGHKWDCATVISVGEDVIGLDGYKGQDWLIINGDVVETYGSMGSSSVSNKEKCYVCNGSGMMRYNYGASDLEAYMDGQDPYTISQCYKCHGSGYIEDEE